MAAKASKQRRTMDSPLFIYLSDELVEILDRAVAAKQEREPDRKVSRAEVVRELIRNAPDSLKLNIMESGAKKRS